MSDWKRVSDMDLNLLVVFGVVANEMSMSVAANQLGVSQPAISKALARLKTAMNDDLIVRSGQGLELTPYGRQLAESVKILLPQLTKIINKTSDYDPLHDPMCFRIAASDDAISLFAPVIANRMSASNATRIEFIDRDSDAFTLLSRQRIDAVIYPDDSSIPSNLNSTPLYDDKMICLVPKSSLYQDRFSLNDYMEMEHVVIGDSTGEQPMPDRKLARLGLKRKQRIVVPFFSTALKCIESTGIVATVPKLFALSERNPHLRIVSAPLEIKCFNHVVVFNPASEGSKAHQWLRELLIDVGRQLRRVNEDQALLAPKTS